MLAKYNLKMPQAVYGGENATDNITAIIRDCGAKRVAIFTAVSYTHLFKEPSVAILMQLL